MTTIDVVINYDPIKGYYKVYEPTTDTLLGSANLTEALCMFNNFLMEKGIVDKGILGGTNITYHLDSYTMNSIIEGNVNLLKQLNSGPGSFVRSSQKFGNSSNSSSGDKKKSRKKRSSGGFQGAKGFGEASKKFGFY